MPRQNTHHKKLHAVMVSSRDYNKEDKNIFQVGCDTVKPSFQNRLSKINWHTTRSHSKNHCLITFQMNMPVQLLTLLAFESHTL
jgi:hypothetical protein